MVLLIVGEYVAAFLHTPNLQRLGVFFCGYVVFRMVYFPNGILYLEKQLEQQE